LKIDSEGIS
jgi:hypothetical protein